MNIFSNPWFIGIGGGVLSGFIVTLVSKYFLGKRDNKEYYQKVLAANHEIIYEIRPCISEGVIPESDVVVALINSTARKFGVSNNDLHGPKEISEELIKEVMDSSFISAAKKSEYCKYLRNMKQPLLMPPSELKISVEPPSKKDREIDSHVYRQHLTNFMSIMIGLMTSLMTFAYSIKDTSFDFFVGKGSLVVPGLIAVLSMIITLVLNILFKDVLKIKHKEDRIDKNRNTDEEETKDIKKDAT